VRCLGHRGDIRIAQTAKSIREVVASGLCIGCGLCEAVTRGRVRMVSTARGSLRPAPIDGFDGDEEWRLLVACPGVTVEARFDGSNPDPVWGTFSSLRFAWAGDPEVRFRAATGGVLTALGCHLIRTGQARFVLHVCADHHRPMRNRWVISETEAEVIARCGSRYGPVAPLAGLEQALEREQPFAVIAKPCDLSAVQRLTQTDDRVDRYCQFRLALVCGGQSRLTKSAKLLAEFDVAEEELAVFRYRGFGNPGRTRFETRDGRAFEQTYLQLWEDEAGWEIETRCKFCPDALGEAADIAAADVWPGGSPVGEDAGFNGLIVRSAAGESLVEAATAAGVLVVGDHLTPRQLDDFQPHQVRKKEKLAARFAGLAQAQRPQIETVRLRVAELGARLGREDYQREVEATVARARSGRFSE